MISMIDLLYSSKNNKFIPEDDFSGNIEYKLRLDKKDSVQRDNMVAQMLWRMNEGHNKYGRHEANYILGICDDGNFSDITELELTKTTNILRGIVKKANSKVISEKIYIFPNNKMITHVVIRKEYTERMLYEMNVIITGPTGIGKSSLMGKLTHGQKDDGNGFTRKLVLRHLHEKTSGNTSSITYDTIGFKNNTLINYSIGIEFNMENIYNLSDRLINLIDIPGDINSFAKTIMYSVSNIKPDNIIICVTNDENYIYANSDIYKFIITVCIVYKIDPIIVITKYDLTLNENDNNIIEIFDKWINELTKQIKINLECITVSNITDHGYSLLHEKLSNITKINKTVLFKEILFMFNDVFTIPDIGTIFHGTLIYGVINVTDKVNIFCHGTINTYTIKSIHRKTIDVERLLSGESGSITFYGNVDKLDKTAIIIDPFWEKNIINKIQIVPFFESIKLKVQQYTLFVGNNIIAVLVILTENNEYYINSLNNITFFLHNEIGILKDDRNNYVFIKFVKSI